MLRFAQARPGNRAASKVLVVGEVRLYTLVVCGQIIKPGGHPTLHRGKEAAWCPAGGRHVQ